MCEMKKCKHCNQELSIDRFYKDKHYKDGYKNICKNGYTNNNEKQLHEFINNMSIRSEADTETIGTFND